MTEFIPTNSQLAILALLSERDSHGYDLEQMIVDRGMRDWTEIGFSSIYFHLNKLEQNNLVSSYASSSAGRGPARRTYRITDVGKQVLVTNLLSALSIPQKGSPAFLLALLNLPLIPHSEIIQALRKYLAALDARRERILQKMRTVSPLPPFVIAGFDYSLTLIQAEAAWINQTIQQMETLEGGSDGPTGFRYDIS